MDSAAYNLTINHLKAHADGYRDRFISAKPFKYVVIR